MWLNLYSQAAQNIYCILYFSVAPSSAPPSLRVVSTTVATINVAWNRIPCQERNGNIEGYTLRVCEVESEVESDDCVLTTTRRTRRAISSLLPRRSYNIYVQAYSDSRRFRSPLSSPVLGTTTSPTGTLLWHYC